MSSSGSSPTCDRSIDDRKKEDLSFLKGVTTAHSEVHVDPPVEITNPVKPPQQQATIVAPPPPPPPPPPSPPPPTISPQTPPPTTSAPKEVMPSTPSPCLYVRFEAEAFHLTNEQNNLPQGDPGLRTFGDFMKRFVSGDEQTIKEVMCKYWSVTKINGVPVSKQDASGNLLADKMYRVPCDKTEIGTLITAFKRYEAYLESPTNKAELETKQHFNPTAQIEYVKVYLQRLTDAQTNPPKDCIGLHETIPGASTSAATAGKAGDGTDRYYGVLPKVFYLLYNQSKTGQPLKAQELLNTYSSLTQDPDELLKAVADDKGPSSHSDIFEPVPVSVLALMNLISEKFPHIYKLKMGTGTGMPDISDTTHHTTEELTHFDPNEITTGLNDILNRIFKDDTEGRKAVEHDFVEAHDKYHKKDTKGAVSSIHNALTKIVDHLELIKPHTDTLSTATAGQTQPAPKPVEAIVGQDSDKEELAKKDAEIADLKAQLAKCSGKSKECDEKIAALEAQKSALEGDKNKLADDLKKAKDEPKADPNKVAGIEQAIAKATADLEALTKELEAEKAKSAQCNTELAAVKARNAELEKELADCTGSKEKLQATQKSCNDENIRLRKQITDLELQIKGGAATDDELERLRKEIEGYKGIIEQNNIIIEKCTKDEAELNRLRTQLNECKTNATNLTNTITRLTDELEVLRNTGNQSKADKARIAALEKQLSECINDRDKQVRELNERITIITKEKTTIEDNLKVIQGQQVASQDELAKLRDELQKCQKAHDDYRIDTEEEIRNLNIQITKITGEKGGSDTELASLRDQLEKCRTERAQYEQDTQARIEILNTQINELNNQKATSDAELAKLKADLETCNKAKEALDEELTTLTVKNKGLVDENTNLNKRIDKLMADISEKDEQLTAALAGKGTSGDRINQLTDELNNLRTELETLRQENTSLKTEIVSLKDVKARMKKYKADRDACRVELDALTKKSGADIEKIKELETNVAELTGLLEKAKTDHAACEKKLSALTTEKDKQINGLRTEVERLTAELAAAKEKEGTSAQTLMEELEAANLNLRRCEAEKAELQAALATEKTRNSALEKELAGCKQERDTLVSRIRVLETELQGAKTSLTAAKSGTNEINDLRILIVNLQRELQEERNKATGVDDLRSKLAAAEQRAAKVPGLEAEVGTLRSKLAAAEQKVNRVAELEAQIRQLMEELAATKTQSERVRQLQAEIERLQGQVRGCDTRIADITSRHTNDIQAVLNVLKGLMSPIAGQLGEMDQGLGDTRSTINAIESLGRSNSLESLQRNMQSAVQSLTAYLGGANINFNKWKELFERTKSLLDKMKQAPAPAYTPAAPASTQAYTPAYTPASRQASTQAYTPAYTPAAPASTGPKIYILTIKTKRGVYPEKTIKIVAAQKMDSMNYTRATESSIGRELNEENIKRCMNTPSANFCKMVERGIEQSEFDNIEYIINVIKSYGFQVTKEGPVSQQEADNIRSARSRQRGGAKYAHGQRDVRYRPDSLKSLAEHQRIWEELKESYDALPEEYKKILPKPGRPPIAHTLEPFTRYIDENAEEDPESIEEARDATDLLGPEEVDQMLESDGETSAMERVKPYYKKALPNLKEEWLPVIIRADIVSRIINDRLDDM